ncbi:hypothetical protein A3B42_02805 [Candidatus Daviesbacteria bacterium RIFCSPLOWO2_01_FULL_38_10]|nr:MAG: hypothetical protein A3B42_02805 [Candidatus Daviesbacteria bacterium RIFCSPLOWO2_01_FULL_38_10]OGE45357.1 MAG: hypothetical protein A3E67_02045 [Candidatus Daviesbacteria bacterium RIFCSPHIGHO2_12_FULL_38_25]OGE73235.1 MAG: hypothetical protein A3H18_02370 [Candidatus Daviesbacteria bacterium RIFCSPLOWO2_12_FULL_38_10]HBQ50398.1 hypothetical protein [Candidatus Daviesbacteria bacterium]HCB23353.1 hypothetical protein [Candidatus Daviesbacteria bacterium]
MSEVETQPDPSLVRSLMDTHVDEEHGVVDLRAVMADLVGQRRNPLDEFRALLQKPGVPGGHHYYAVQGLRSLALAEGLSLEDSRFLLVQTRRLTESPVAIFDDGYYDTLGVLSAWSNSAPALVEWAEETLTKKDIYNWRWLAGFALGRYWNGGKRPLSGRIIDRFQAEIVGEEDLHRKGQMEEMAANFRRSCQPSPTS